MAENIERETAVKLLRDTAAEGYPTPFHLGLYAAAKAIEAIPAADVRPVVVCADCEYNNHCLTQEFVDDCGKIPLDRNTFFCADGERRSNA